MLEVWFERCGLTIGCKLLPCAFTILHDSRQLHPQGDSYWKERLRISGLSDKIFGLSLIYTPNLSALNQLIHMFEVACLIRSGFLIDQHMVL